MRDERFYLPYQGPSTNEIYGGVHWYLRMQHKNAARTAVQEHIDTDLFENPVTLHFVPIVGRRGRRRDLTNYTYGIKLIEDGLVEAGVLADDTQSHVRSVRIHQAIVDRSQANGFIVRIVETEIEAPVWAHEALP